MFAIFQEEKLITVLMLTFFGISILMRMLLGLMYQSMIREADNMAATNNKLLKQCKLKFANCYQLGNGVANIPVFVDKFLNRLSLGPFSFETMYHFSGQAMLFSVVCAGFGICRSILQGRMLGEILPFYIASFLGLYLYFSISTIVNIQGKKRILKTNLVDYLENHLSPRINVTEDDMEMLYGDRQYLSRRRKRNILGDGGRRTVELMPISGGRLAADSGSGSEHAKQEDGLAENAYRILETESVGPATRPRYDDQHSSEVSEEELEALLREFLV